MRKIFFERPANAPKAKEGNLPDNVKGKGKFNKVKSTTVEATYSKGEYTERKQVVEPVKLTNKDLAKMRREKSKRDRKEVAKGSIKTNWKPF